MLEVVWKYFHKGYNVISFCITQEGKNDFVSLDKI